MAAKDGGAVRSECVWRTATGTDYTWNSWAVCMCCPWSRSLVSSLPAVDCSPCVRPHVLGGTECPEDRGRASASRTWV